MCKFSRYIPKLYDEEIFDKHADNMDKDTPILWVASLSDKVMQITELILIEKRYLGK